MAAVLALVMLPTIAAIGFFVGAVSGASLTTLLAGCVFIALSLGVLVGSLRIVHDVETN